MKVFLSSVITGFEPFRDAATHAIQLLGHEVIRAEDFPASPASPQQACLAGVRQSDLVVLLLGSRYGYRQASGKAATDEEFEEAARSKALLVFDQADVERDDDMKDFASRVQDWVGGTFTAAFSTPEQLRDRVTRAVADHAVAEQAARIDDDEILARAMAFLPDERNHASDLLGLVVAAGPTQQVLRPGEIERSELCQALKQEAMFGSAPVLDSNRGARCQIRGDSLSISNDDESFIVDPMGSVAITRSVRQRPAAITGLNPLIEEDVAEAIERALRFASIVLGRIDPLARLTVVAPVAAIHGNAMGWRTRAEQAASPNMMSIGFGTHQAEPVAHLSPVTRPRRHLVTNVEELAEDLTVLLRRQVTS